MSSWIDDLLGQDFSLQAKIRFAQGFCQETIAHDDDVLYTRSCKAHFGGAELFR